MRLPLLAVFFLILTFPSATVAQTWAELYSKAQQSYSEEKYEEALSAGNQALLLFLNEQNQKVDNHAAILRLIQNVYYDLSEYEKGLVFAEKEVSIRESDKSNHYAEALNQVGYFHQAL